MVRCNLCRRTTHFLATDLVRLLNPDRDALRPPYSCSKCRKVESIQVTLRWPEPGDYGSLQVRRPGAVRVTQTWKTVKLGD